MVRDLNGRSVPMGRVARLMGRLWAGRAGAAEVSVADTDLVVVAQSFDDAAASSQVLADSRWRADEQAVLRHILLIPERLVDGVVATAAQEGYRRVEVGDSPGVSPAGDLDLRGRTVIGLARPQLVDALHCSQERSRMAGLGVRNDGTVLGWQVLQRAVH